MSDQESQIKIGDLLKNKGIITDKHIRYALNVQKVTREKLGKVLTRVGLVAESELVQTVAQQLDLKVVDLQKVDPEMELLRLFNRNFCLNNRVFPVRKKNSTLLLVTSELPTSRLSHSIQRISGLTPKFALTEESRLLTYIYNYFFFLENPVEELLHKEIRTLSADSSRTVSPDNFLHYLLLFAVKLRSTDIHLRPMPQGISVVFRIDGVLQDIAFMPKHLSRVITSIKLHADMDISEQRLPQDGRWNTKILERSYDIRVSTVVTPDGENVVMRLLSQEQASFSLGSLGFMSQDVPTMIQAFNEPFGVVLLTGPTGSGKSTTLVAGLNSLDLIDKNVLTIENPIEYLVPLARQTQVNQAAGYDFSNAMRHFLRHDPDVILVGEMRDEPTANMAMMAATTGHMVLSTLHANTALGAIPRLYGLGVDSQTLSEALLAVVSQRLLRTLCPYCYQTASPTQEELDYLNKEVKTLYVPQGCDACNQTGYRGRTILYENLIFDSTLRGLLERRVELHTLEEKAYEQGFRNMFHIGVSKVESGQTSVAELQRVIGRVR